MTKQNLIKSIDYNRDLENPYINVELEDGRFALVQLDKEENKLHANYGEYSITIDSSCDDNLTIIDEDLVCEILLELQKRFKEEVEDFENILPFEVERYHEYYDTKF
jgi:hypothetical protein